jgi:hypothetical protein
MAVGSQMQHMARGRGVLDRAQEVLPEPFDPSLGVDDQRHRVGSSAGGSASARRDRGRVLYLVLVHLEDLSYGEDVLVGTGQWGVRAEI